MAQILSGGSGRGDAGGKNSPHNRIVMTVVTTTRVWRVTNTPFVDDWRGGYSSAAGSIR
jgi:hypothetical protein